MNKDSTLLGMGAQHVSEILGTWMSPLVLLLPKMVLVLITLSFFFHVYLYCNLAYCTIIESKFLIELFFWLLLLYVDIVAAAVLSGNRNFEGRVHPLTRANYLASPPLVVAYALAGTVSNFNSGSEKATPFIRSLYATF